MYPQDYVKTTDLRAAVGDGHNKDIPKEENYNKDTLKDGSGRAVEYARRTVETSNSVVNRFYEIYESNEMKKGVPKRDPV